MNKMTRHVLTTVSVMAALAAAVGFNVSDAEAASTNTCAVGPFIPVTCPALNAGVQEGVAGAQDQPVVDFLGVADTLANGAAGVCRATANYPGGVTRATQLTSGLNVSAFPVGSAAGWYFEPTFPMVSVTIRCF